MISDKEAREYAHSLLHSHKDLNDPLRQCSEGIIRDRILEYLILKVQELEATINYMDKEVLGYYDPDER